MTLRDLTLSGADAVSAGQQDQPGPLGYALALVAVPVTLLALDNLRTFGDPVLGAFVRLETHYYYGLMALLLPFAFLRYPGINKRWFVWVNRIRQHENSRQPGSHIR